MNLLTTLILSPPLAYFTFRVIKEEMERYEHKKKAQASSQKENGHNGIIKVVPTIKTFHFEVGNGKAN